MAEPQLIRLEQPFKGKITASALSDVPPGCVIDSRDVLPRDWRTGKARLAVRPGYSEADDLSNAVGLFTLGSAFDEAGGVQLMAATANTLYRWTGSAWSSVGSITNSASRTIHAASYGKQLFVACNDPYVYYDYDEVDPIDPWTATSAGTIPPNCRIVASYGPRAVLLADPDNPHVVNFSRADDWFDWDVTEEDSGAAISIPIGEAATCGFEHNRNCFIVGTKHGMWIFRGNPAAANAVVEKFSFVVGPINSSAWCKSADDYTFMLGHNGLYRMAPGCGAPPEEVSRNLIPDALVGLDGTNSKAYLVYDERFRGVQIHVQGTNAASWFYDIDGGGFWPITAPGASILAAHRFGPLDSATASGSLVATSTGVFRLDSAQALGGSDAAYATMLMPLAPLGYKSQIQKGVAHFGSNTNDTTGTVNIYGGETATLAAALGNARKSSVTIGKLQTNHGTWHPRIGGTFAAVKILQGSTSAHWSLEAASLATIPHGTERG